MPSSSASRGGCGARTMAAVPEWSTAGGGGGRPEGGGGRTHHHPSRRPPPTSPIAAAQTWSSCAMAAMASMADKRGPSASAVTACSGHGVATSNAASALWTAIRSSRSSIELRKKI